MFKRYSFLILCFTIAVNASDADFDALGIVPCKIDSPDRDDCVRKMVQDVLPKLKDGAPGLNIPALEPFVIGQNTFHIRRNSSGVDIFAAGKVRNVRLYGITQTKILSSKTTINGTHFHRTEKLYAPNMVVDGLYRGETSFFTLSVRSKGYFNITGTDVTLTTQTDGIFIEEDGIRHLKITNISVDPTIGDMKTYATGLFPDPEMNSAALEVLNENWPYIYKDTIADTRNIWEPVLLRAANNFLLSIPLERLLY